MAEKKQPSAEEQATSRHGDKAHAGGKPGKIGDTNVAPEHDPEMERSGRRELGRDG